MSGTEYGKRSIASKGMWSFMNEMGAIASRDAVNRVARVIRADNRPGGRSDGSGRIRSSGIGYCERKQVLSYIGAPQNAIDMSSVTQGTWTHYRWQTAGLTQGFLSSVETKARMTRRGIRFGGAVDGIMSDGSLFELKSMKPHNYKRLAAPRHEHVMQVNMYMGILSIDVCSLVYEPFDDIATRTEWAIPYDASLFEETVEHSIAMVGRYRTDHLLPHMDPACVPKSWMRNGCGFREACLGEWLRAGGGAEE